jgi:transcriptional regulator with XRE-family HTH domain
MTAGPLPLSSEVADRIRAFRTTRRISGEELADGLTGLGYKISRSVLGNIETKRFKTIPVDLLAVVLEYFDVSWYAFFAGPLCNGCNDDPPKTYICKVCGRTRDPDGELVKC